MANGDIPVEGSPVDSGIFEITAKNFAEDGNKSLMIRTTQGKKLHIFIDTDLTNPDSKKFDEDINNENWKLAISES